MENLQIWNKLKDVPKEAQKTISSGDLKGMTDIKPQWRLKVMTEVFGPAGVGWYYEIINKSIEEGNNGEKCGFVDINLYYKLDGEWSKPIPGTGGNSFVQFFNQKKYYKTSDEVFKMALTDALSVAMKAIGVGATIYMGQNSGAKYTSPSAANVVEAKVEKEQKNQAKPTMPDSSIPKAVESIKKGEVTIAQIEQKYTLTEAQKKQLTSHS